MQIFLKRTLCTILVLCTFSFVCMTGATEDTNQALPTGVINNQNTDTTSPMSSDIALDRSITRSNASWYQPSGYPSYRVWVENTTNYIMTVRITAPTGLTSTFLVPAGGSNKYVSNNATNGAHDLTFSTTGNVLGGTVRVRVSTVPQT